MSEKANEVKLVFNELNNKPSPSTITDEQREKWAKDKAKRDAERDAAYAKTREEERIEATRILGANEIRNTGKSVLSHCLCNRHH